MEAERKRILIIDDEKLIRQTIADFLEDVGYEPVEAPDGDEGIRRFRETKPDAVLVDLRMPDMDGLDVLNLLAGESSETPLVVVSGVGAMQDAIEALRRGAWDFIRKPIEDLGLLEHALRRGLERARLLRENRRYRDHLEEEIVRRTADLLETNVQLRREVLERREAEKMLRRYESIVSATDDFMAFVGPDLRYLAVNDAYEHLLGLPKEAFVGRRVGDILGPGLLTDWMRESLEKAAAGELVVRREWFDAFPGGSRYIECRLFPHHERDGSFIGFALSVRDMTAQQHAEREAQERERQLRQADKMAALGTLVAGVAHEINNPNGVIMLNAPLLEEIWRGVEPLLREAGGGIAPAGVSDEEYLGRVPYLLAQIRDAADRIRDIVAELKGFARQDVSELTQPVDVNEAVRTAASLVSNKLRKATTRFGIEYAPAPLHVRGNLRRLEQVFVNALINSCEALTDAAQAVAVHVSPSCDGSEAIVEFRDEGAGIDAGDMAHLFEPFFTTKRALGGTGLGLSVSLGIVEDHGGRIEVDSCVGRGTSLRVVLPALAAPGGAGPVVSKILQETKGK